MIRQSEIANFLDLIKHITESRNFKSVNPSLKSTKKHRYEETEYDQESDHNQRRQTRKSQHSPEQQENKEHSSQFQHKMLKITHEIKKKPRSFKLESFEAEKGHYQSQIELGNKMNQFRSNLYQNYCQMIRRKRQQKINKMFRNSGHEINRRVCNISDTVHFDSNNDKRSFKDSPFVKSKTLKPGIQPVRLKRHQKSKKKLQPQQLNIETMKSVKMPKLSHPLSYKRESFKLQKYRSIKRNKVAINKIGNLQGWAQEQDKNTFNIDYF